MEKIEELLMQKNGVKNVLLKCNVCKHFLSVSPVVHNDIIGNVCGRENCQILTNSKGKNYRQSAYETIARFLKFPCMYRENGCEEKLCFDSIGEHEKNCKFMFFVCPFSVNKFGEKDTDECPWQGEYSTFLYHLEEIHNPHSFENYVQLNIENFNKRNNLFFWRLKNSIVIVLVVQDEKSLYWKVWCGTEIWRTLSYKIEVTSEKEKMITASKIHNAELINPAFFKGEIGNTWIETNINQMENFFGSFNSFKLRFYISGFIVGPLLKPSLLDNICRNCSRGQGIFRCVSNDEHRYCKECVPKNCGYINGRNLCGANIPLKLTFMVEHLRNHCKLCFQKVDCLSSHMYNFHNESIFNLNEYHDGSHLEHHLFAFDDHLFLLKRIKSSNSDLSLSVECLETFSIQYKYEITLMNSSTSCLAITLTHFCNPEFIKTTNGTGNPQVLIPKPFLNNFLPFDDLESMKFKINILKLQSDEILQT